MPVGGGADMVVHAAPAASASTGSPGVLASGRVRLSMNSRGGLLHCVCTKVPTSRRLQPFRSAGEHVKCLDCKAISDGVAASRLRRSFPRSAWRVSSRHLVATIARQRQQLPSRPAVESPAQALAVLLSAPESARRPARRRGQGNSGRPCVASGGAGMALRRTLLGTPLILQRRARCVGGSRRGSARCAAEGLVWVQGWVLRT